MLKRPISPEAIRLVESVRSELATPEGRAKLMKALERAEEASKRFREASKVDSATLRIPFDI